MPAVLLLANDKSKAIRHSVLPTKTDRKSF